MTSSMFWYFFTSLTFSFTWTNVLLSQVPWPLPLKSFTDWNQEDRPVELPTRSYCYHMIEKLVFSFCYFVNIFCLFLQSYHLPMLNFVVVHNLGIELFWCFFCERWWGWANNDYDDSYKKLKWSSTFFDFYFSQIFLQQFPWIIHFFALSFISFTAAEQQDGQ